MLQCGSVLGVFSQNSAASFKRRLREQWDIIRLECFGILGPKCTLHGLRATFAMSQYQALDCDILLVKQLLGHKSINSTMHYVHAVNLDEMQKRILSVYTRKPNKKAG
jgi:integrase